MGDDSNKMYVGGLAMETSNESLRNHFLQFGDLVDCIVMMDKTTGRSRGFGFVTFRDAAAMSVALGTSQVVDGREVPCKKATREGLPSGSGPGAGPGDEGNASYNVVKIFVGGLPATAERDKFTAYFSQFGKVEDAVVMMDNLTGRHRGFGYVTFADPSAVEATIQNYSSNQIDGKWIEVKRCIPQDRMAPGSSSKGKGKGKAAPYAAMGGYGAYGASSAYGTYSYSAAAAAYGAYGGMGAMGGGMGGGLTAMAGGGMAGGYGGYGSAMAGAMVGAMAGGGMAGGYGGYAAAGYGGAVGTGYSGYSPY